MKQTKEPMVTNVNQVHTTTDYFLFTPIEGNRTKNLLHINRLKKSMEKTYLFTIIIVNEKYEIIDGQHRFDVITELKLPLHYIVCDGYGLNEVHVLNQNSKNWTANDYLDGYCSLGYKPYLRYREFKEDFGFGHNECMALLGGSDSGGTFKKFYAGEFKIKDYDLAFERAVKISAIGEFYEGYVRARFVRAMNILFKNPQFDYDQFISKLERQPTALKDCTDSKQYIGLIEDIYNYRRRDKVNLRYY